jgi:hypothetical protein
MNVENVTITGRGVVTTNNADWTQLMGRPQGVAGGAFGPVWEALRTSLEQKTPAPEEEYVKAAPYLRPAFIRFMESKNVLVEGIHMVGSSFWTIHMLYSSNVVIRGVTLETYPGAFTGGIYIDSSRDVRIADCYVDTGDDAIVLKSGKDADGRRVNRPTENVTITNCVVHHGSGAVVLGSEMSGGIRNVVASNIVCQGTQMGINLKSDRGRGGVIENIRLDNWTMDDVGRAINVSQYYVHEGNVTATPPRASERTPAFRNISISNMNIIRCRAAVGYEPAPPVMINIEGLPEMPISGLRISHALATDHGSVGARRGRQLQSAAARVRRHPAVSQLERPGRQRKEGQDRPGSRPAGGQWRLRGEHVAGTRRAEVPFAGAHGPGEVRGPGSGQEAGDEAVAPGRIRLPQRVCRRQDQQAIPATRHAGHRRRYPHPRDARPDAHHAGAAGHAGIMALETAQDRQLHNVFPFRFPRTASSSGRAAEGSTPNEPVTRGRWFSCGTFTSVRRRGTSIARTARAPRTACTR